MTPNVLSVTKMCFPPRTIWGEGGRTGGARHLPPIYRKWKAHMLTTCSRSSPHPPPASPTPLWFLKPDMVQSERFYKMLKPSRFRILRLSDV